jgi:hypothetical protein
LSDNFKYFGPGFKSFIFIFILYWTSQAKPSRANPSQVNPSQAKPTQPKPTQANPSQPKPTQANPSQPKPTQAINFGNHL